MNLIQCPDACGQVYNMGSQEEISIEAVADKIIQMTQSQSVKEHLSYEQAYGKPFDDMRKRVPCLERSGQTIGYSPKYTFEQTLELVIGDGRERLA